MLFYRRGETRACSASSLYGRILGRGCATVSSFLAFLSAFLTFPASFVGKSFSISLESFTRQDEIGATGMEGAGKGGSTTENEEGAVNHAGKVEAVRESAG